ncbi:hypothetical protein ACROYT_G032748 [Oculina patagonica]
MTSHAKTAIGKAVEYVNPGQTVVIACDQPLFALAKTVEWAQKDRTWEDKLEVMLGGLHIEQAALKAFGTSLAGSGWVEVLSQATQATAGRERNHLSTVHVLRALDGLGNPFEETCQFDLEKEHLKFKSSRTNCPLFSKRNIGCQNRGSNLDNQHLYLIEETRYRTQKNGTGRSARKHGDRYGAQ